MLMFLYNSSASDRRPVLAAAKLWLRCPSLERRGATWPSRTLHGLAIISRMRCMEESLGTQDLFWDLEWDVSCQKGVCRGLSQCSWEGTSTPHSRLLAPRDHGTFRRPPGTELAKSSQFQVAEAMVEELYNASTPKLSGNCSPAKAWVNSTDLPCSRTAPGGAHGLCSQQSFCRSLATPGQVTNFMPGGSPGGTW